MPDTPEIEVPVETPAATRVWLQSIRPEIALIGGLVLLCVGVWVGFKLVGGEVANEPCLDCAERKAQQGRHVAEEATPDTAGE